MDSRSDSLSLCQDVSRGFSASARAVLFHPLQSIKRRVESGAGEFEVLDSVPDLLSSDPAPAFMAERR